MERIISLPAILFVLDGFPNDPSYCDMAKLYGMELDGKSFEEVLKIIETTKSQGGWLIFAGRFS